MPASTARSCHDDPIADSSALHGYDIRGQLGRGVWGTVSEAVDPRGQRVAVKELHASLVADPDARRRFAAIASVLTSIDHPHVVRVVDYADDDGRCLLVSELLDGNTLRQRTRAGVSPEVACALVLAVASGVDRAARAGTLHRDLKPENVLFTSTGVPEVSDFGLAEIVSGSRTLAT
ncbi:MAG TPA: protein kinase, partial [Mycobacteriales bacterium]|nr:protein kinase [Mycobacteriales bacterium]